MEIVSNADSNKAFQILKAANKENPTSKEKEALLKLYDENPHIWQNVTDLNEAVQNNILKSDVFKSFVTQESIRRKLASMRDRLGWETASELEKILIEQVCLNWLRLNLMENLHNTKTFESHTTETGLYWDKRLNATQRRYLRACETLAKVRKLLADAELKEQQAQNQRQHGNFLTNKLLKDSIK